MTQSSAERVAFWLRREDVENILTAKRIGAGYVTVQVRVDRHDDDYLCAGEVEVHAQ